MSNTVTHINVAKIWNILETVKDPEIPVLTIVDLGIVRDVRHDDGELIITITPTYSGCPAMHMIEEEIRMAVEAGGVSNFKIETTLSPAWTTDWMSESGKQKLEAYGIAPPAGASSDKSVLFGQAKQVRCPQCKSMNTELINEFGSTACKALYRCKDCLEPFDYFKCL